MKNFCLERTSSAIITRDRPPPRRRGHFATRGRPTRPRLDLARPTAAMAMAMEYEEYAATSSSKHHGWKLEVSRAHKERRDMDDLEVMNAARASRPRKRKRIRPSVDREIRRRRLSAATSPPRSHSLPPLPQERLARVYAKIDVGDTVADLTSPGAVARLRRVRCKHSHTFVFHPSSGFNI